MSNIPPDENYDDNWLKIDDIFNETFDEQLSEKAKKYNMTERHVKTLIYKVCSDKQVAEFTKKISESNFDDDLFHAPETIHITRKKLKNISEDISIQPTNPPLDFENIIPHVAIIPRAEYNSDANVDLSYSKTGNVTQVEELEKTYNDSDEELWYKWLEDFKNPMPSDIDINDELEDEDFKLNNDEIDKEDEEEFRTDRAVHVSSREIRLLLNELDQEEISLCVTKNRADIKSIDDFPIISVEDRHVIIAQMQQHIQLLVQFYMLCTYYKISGMGAPQSLYFLKEISYFASCTKSSECTNKRDETSQNISTFNNTNILEALKMVEMWDQILTGNYTPAIFGASPANGMVPNTNVFLGHFLQITCWTNFKYPILPVMAISFFLTQPFFAAFSNLLPSHGLFVPGDKDNYRSDLEVGFCSVENQEIMNNFRLKFTKAETYLLLLGYFQCGDDYFMIHQNMLPTRLANRLKGRFRWLLQHPQKMDLEVKMMLMRGYVDFSMMQLPLVSDEPDFDVGKPFKSPLLFSQKDGDFAPYWIPLARCKKHWVVYGVNYDFLSEDTIKTKYQTEAFSALNTGRSLMIQSNIILKRNSKFDIDISYDATTGLATETFVSLNSAKSHPLFNLSIACNALDETYKKMPFFRACEMKTDTLNICACFSRVLLEILKDFYPNKDSFNKVLTELGEIPTENYQQTINSLIILSKEHQTFIDYIAYIYGLRNRGTSNRFWHNFIQLCRNFKELQEALEFDSYHHRKFLIFLYQLETLNLPSMNIEEVMQLFPISMSAFRHCPISSENAVPSLFKIIQEYYKEEYVELMYEEMNHPPVPDTGGVPDNDFLYFDQRLRKYDDLKKDDKLKSSI